MKIIFDARRHTFCTTGVGRVIEGLLNTLVKIDKKNQYLVLYGDRNPLPECKHSNVQLTCVDLDINSLTINWEIPAIAKKWGADAAYFPFWFAPIKMPCPSVVTIHDLVYSVYPKYLSPTKRLAAHLYTGLILKTATSIQSVSQFTKRELFKYYNTSQDKVDVVYNAVDTRFYMYPPSNTVLELPININLPKVYILYAGNHKPHKNLEGIFRAYQLVQNQLESDLVIAGAKSNYQDPFSIPYLDFVRKLGIEKRVHFVGQISDLELARVFNQARFFVFPSLYEGFGIPPLEAMTCGVPVVCSDIPSLHEVLGDSAVFFNPLDVANIADQFIKLEKNQDLRDNYKARGLERAKLFSWENSAIKWLESMEKVRI